MSEDLIASLLLSENGLELALFFISCDPSVDFVKLFNKNIQINGISHIITRWNVFILPVKSIFFFSIKK